MIELTEQHLNRLGFDPGRLQGATGFTRIEALRDAGLIKPQPALESIGPVSTAEIAAAATALALGGSLSELIIAERAESY